MSSVQSLEKFLASDAGIVLKQSAKFGAKATWKLGNGHVKCYHGESGKEIEHVNLTADENRHLQNGGRLLLVYACGHEVHLSF